MSKNSKRKGRKLKYAIVTGASRGIGKYLSLSLLKKGYFVFLVSKSKENLNILEKELTYYKGSYCLFPCDVSNLEDVKITFEQINCKTNNIDVLINCAGISKVTLLEDENYQDWINQINVNLNGTYYFSKEVYKSMKNNNFGRIINISSLYGLIGGEGYSAYCASKHGVIGLTKSMALECAKYNITVNSICSGWVETDMFYNDMEELSEKYNIDKNILIDEEKIAIPTKRFTGLDEISDLVIYLISNSAKNITGQSINISGGLAI